MEPKKFASILNEKLEKIKQERDIEEKWDNKLIKNLSEVCGLNKISDKVHVIQFSMFCINLYVLFQLKFDSESGKIDDPKMLDEMFRATLKLPDGSDDEILGVFIEQNFNCLCNNKEKAN